MITKITAQKLLQSQLNLFFFSKLTQQGKSVVSQLPNVQVPVRAKYENEDRFSKKIYYDINNYQHHDRPPRCRYYALQYKNRIYHVFNAYYYVYYFITKPMGRMIGKIATAIRGKNSPLYRNSQSDVKNGDVCVIVNASDPLFTGKKLLYKNLKYHTGFVGHLKTYSYKHVLNHKPELLYYYLLRKFMPKNKVSGKYMENVKIFRGPTHTIPHLPQFAPDKNIYEYLPESNLQEYIRLNPDVKVLAESQPGLAQKQYGRKFQYFKSQQETQKEQQLIDEQAEDTSKLHKKTPQMKQTLNYSPKQIEKLKRKEERHLDRYRRIGAPYKAKNLKDKGYLYIKDERKARKMEEYRVLADEDLQEEEEQVVTDPFGRKAAEAAKKAASGQGKKK